MAAAKQNTDRTHNAVKTNRFFIGISLLRISGTVRPDKGQLASRRKDNRKRDVGSEHTARVMTAKRHHRYLMLRSVFAGSQFCEGLAARQPGRPLSHRRARRIEPAERKDIDFAQQVSY